MLVAHNMMASFTNRQLGINTQSKANSSERLASGYRINRASDDAAGLAISEKMRGQIRGLERASLNAQDGIALIQTAEGALNEIHDMLQRMNELSVQAANDTNTAEDREIIEEEISWLVEEINHISDATEFNTRPILQAEQLVEIDGKGFGNVPLSNSYTITTAGSPSTSRNVYGTYIDFGKITSANVSDLFGKSFTTTCTQNCSQVFTFSFADKELSASSATVNGNNMSIEIGVNNVTQGEEIVNKIIDLVSSMQGTTPFDTYDKTKGDLYIGHANGITSDGSKFILYSIKDGPTYASGMGLLKAGSMLQEEGTIYFQIGANSEQSVPYKIKTINSSTLGLDGIMVSSHVNAGNAITAIQGAIEGVSEYRAYLGAMQNRLEHTIVTDDNTAENLQAAESRIRDANMAEEMVAFAKNSILEQAATALLTQANQSTQGVLQLLQ